MPGELPPGSDWVPVVNEDALTREDARKLAGAINGVAEVVGRLSERMALVESGRPAGGALGGIQSISVNCECGRCLFSSSDVDFARMDWGAIGRGLAEHMAEHTRAGQYWTTNARFQMYAYPKQAR